MARRRNTYTVMYRMYWRDKVKSICVIAYNMADAYDVATYEAIPVVEGTLPYSSWVHSVTYENGNYRVFKYTMEGNPY